jgi:hypothetical protein
MFSKPVFGLAFYFLLGVVHDASPKGSLRGLPVAHDRRPVVDSLQTRAPSSAGSMATTKLAC